MASAENIYTGLSSSYTYDANGNEKASYSYNAWGKILSATGDMASVNPLRYRGYYYDDDTGFYYLKGRYYDPQIQRFINADELASTGQGIIGTNMFAYCGNNPVLREDSNGDIWVALATMAVGGVIGAAISAASSALAQKVFTGTVNVKSVLVAAGTGFVSGAVAGSPLGAAGQKIAGGVIGGLSYAVDCYVNGKEMRLGEGLAYIGFGVLSGRIGGPGANEHMTLSNTVKMAGRTIKHERQRANQKYAQKAIASAISYRNNTFANAAWGSSSRYAAGAGISSVGAELVNVLTSFLDTLPWKFW